MTFTFQFQIKCQKSLQIGGLLTNKPNDQDLLRAYSFRKMFGDTYQNI